MSDLISREAVLKLFATHDGNYLYEAIRDMPSAQPERKAGKWTDDNACPFCGFHPWYERDIHTLSYCPNCGADMRGEQDE